jgi:hypothetical protein
MNRLSAAFVAAVVLALGASTARADFVSWSYNFTPSELAIPADPPGTGGLSLTNEPEKQADGTSDVVVTNIRGFSSAPRGTPDKFTHANVSFSLVLTDELSRASADLTFSGFFSGTISATSANVQFTPTAPLTQTVTLGGNVYTITFGSYAPPGPPTASNAGSLSAHVAVNESNGVNGTPEPSTLLRSCLGLGGLGLVGVRRWRRPLSPVTKMG